MRCAAGAVLLCVALAGCGGDKSGREAGATPAASDPITVAADRTVEAGDARIEGRMWIRIGEQRIPMDVTGAVSFADDRLALHVDYAEGSVPGATPRAMRRLRWKTGYPRDQILDAGVAYLQDPRIRKLAAPDRWHFVDLAKVHEAGEIDLRRLAGMPEVNPAAMVEFLRTTGVSREEGVETIGGAPRHRYSVRVDYAAHPERVPAEERAAAERTVAQLARWWGDSPIDVTVWTDPVELIRRLRFSFTLTVVHETYPATAEFDLVDHGNAPPIDIPAVEDASDSTPLAIEHAR